MKRKKDQTHLNENNCEHWNRCIVVVCVSAQPGLKTFSLSCLCHPEDGSQYIHGLCLLLSISKDF